MNLEKISNVNTRIETLDKKERQEILFKKIEQNQFLKTEELPYKNTKAYMLIEDFLRRYLPENRRGKVILKEVNSERKDFWFKLRNDIQLIKLEWDNLLKNGNNFDSFINGNESIKEVLVFIDLEDRKKYINFLKTMYSLNISWTKFPEHKNEDIRKIDEKINQAMKDDLYKDKELFIV